MTIDTQRLTGADLFLSKLRQLPANVVSRRGGPVKRALRKGAQLIQREAQRNILRIEG